MLPSPGEQDLGHTDSRDDWLQEEVLLQDQQAQAGISRGNQVEQMVLAVRSEWNERVPRSGATIVTKDTANQDLVP